MDRLHPCPSCARHVRASERVCPFCASTLSEPAALTAPTGRLGRAAIFAFRATTALTLGTLGGCGEGAPEPTPTVQTPPEETIMQPYGAPPLPPEPPVPPTPPPDETIMQPYGAPPSPPDPTPPPSEPEATSDDDPPATHDQEHHRRPPRRTAIPAYGVPSPHGPDGPLDF